ncbi:MAG: FeoA family protein [Candidatus Cloacimonadaceae bacterium]|nr:FeoA family protein [Candidatus Cloacimonadaceae bacterium]
MFSSRNRVRLRRLGRRFLYSHRHCKCKRGDCISLSELGEGRSAMVTCNNDIRIIERGLYMGVSVSMLRNDPGQPNIVIAVGDARYVLDRRIADSVRVRVS